MKKPRIVEFGKLDGLETPVTVKMTVADFLAISAMIGMSNQYQIADDINQSYALTSNTKDLMNLALKDNILNYVTYRNMAKQIQIKIRSDVNE